MSTSAGTYYLGEEHPRHPSLDLELHEAREQAQNRPLWRLISLYSATHSYWCMLLLDWCVCTVKLRYNGLPYNVSSVIAYTSSRSRHFCVQNVLVITYLDPAYPRLLRTDFWAQTLQRTRASMYVRPPHRLRSWFQSVTCRQSVRNWCCRHVARCQIGGADCF